MTRELQSQSPIGVYAIEVIAWEAAMSLWVESPVLIDRTSGLDLLRFRDANWSLDQATWLDDSRVRLLMRRYPGNHSPPDVDVVVDCKARTGQMGHQEIHSLDELEDAMNLAIQPSSGGM